MLPTSVTKKSAISFPVLSLAIAIVACFCVLGCEKEPPVTAIQQPPTNDGLQFSGNPIAVKSPFSVTSKPLTEYDQATVEFQKQLDQLANYAGEIRRESDQPRRPNVLAEQFEATLLERDKLTSAYLGERIRIARWRLTEQTPTFYESIALDRLFRTLLEPWKQATRFNIEFKLHEVRDRPNYYDAQILMNISGAVPAQTVRADGGKEEIGRDAIGLWQIVWKKQDDNKAPKIKKINMLAHEETVNYVTAGKLFVDCTGSVLRNDAETKSTLSLGLDQWCKRIPGIDPIGNNGLAIGDLNSDGLDDIYICQPHGMANILLQQNPDGTADDIAAVAGVNIYDESQAALIVDLDNDGHQDLAVATDSRLVLFSNRGDGTFQLEHQLKTGPGTDSLSAADYDQDGDLDLFLAKYRPVAKFDDIFPQPNSNVNANNGGRNILLRNDEAWKFNDVTSDTGFNFNNQYYTTSAIWNDYDSDGDMDLYLVNEFQQDSLFVNDNGWFTDSFETNVSLVAGRSTTASVADFNGDGRPDFLIGTDSSFAAQRVTKAYIDAGGKLLRDARGFGPANRIVYSKERQIAQYDFRPPIFSTESTYSSVTGDFNNDGLEDVAATNGWLSGAKRKSSEVRFLRNLFDPANDLEILSKKDVTHGYHEISDQCRQGSSFNGHQRNSCILTLGSFRFANLSNSSGLNFPDDSRAIARTDWDGDGDIDLVINNRTAPRLRILQNQYLSKNQFLKIHLRGTSSNRDAVGSRVEVFLRGNSNPIVRVLTAGSGRKSQSSKVLHFGLGKFAEIEKVIVNWPNGQTQTFKNINVNATYRLVEGELDAAEFSNDRYRIALEPAAIEKSSDFKMRKHVRFFPTTRVPLIQYREPNKTKRKKWYQVQNSDSRPLLCILSPSDFDSRELLRQWNERKNEVLKLNGDVLLLFSGIDDDNDHELDSCAEQVESSNFEFRWGVLSESSNVKLAQCFGQWFFDYDLPKTPVAWLQDADGNIHFAYDQEQLNWEAVEGDFMNLADKNFILNHVPVHSEEMWIERRRTPRFDRLAMRFGEMGYDRDVSYLEEFVTAQRSDDYMNRAIDLASKGNLRSALNAIEQSRELDPESVEAMITMADITVQYSGSADQQARTRMLINAGELLDQALENEPNNVEAILARAEIFRKQRDIENALLLLNKYLEINPENWEVHAIIGRLYFHNKKYLEATRFLITAIDNRPTLPYVAGDLGFLYLLHRQFGDARQFLELANRLHPSDPKQKRYLAESEFWLGNFESAGNLFSEVVLTEPTLTHGKQMLAWLKATSPFSNFRDGQQALDIIQPFVELKGERSPISLEIMAASFAEIGDFQQAVSLQRNAIDSVENDTTLEKFTPEQLKAQRDRLELYKRQRPYRMKEPAEAPMPLLGNNN